MSKYRMIVNTKTQTAELWNGSQLEKTYTVSTAANGTGCEPESFCTPTGKLRVAQKIGDRLPLGGVLKARIPTGEIWTTDPQNPLSKSTQDLILTRILWLEGAEPHNANTLDRFIYLHGTNQEDLLGQPASHGCVRFSNLDIIEVFEILNEGDEVQIV